MHKWMNACMNEWMWKTAIMIPFYLSLKLLIMVFHLFMEDSYIRVILLRKDSLFPLYLQVENVVQNCLECLPNHQSISGSCLWFCQAQFFFKVQHTYPSYIRVSLCKMWCRSYIILSQLCFFFFFCVSIRPISGIVWLLESWLAIDLFLSLAHFHQLQKWRSSRDHLPPKIQAVS